MLVLRILTLAEFQFWGYLHLHYNVSFEDTYTVLYRIGPHRDFQPKPIPNPLVLYGAWLPIYMQLENHVCVATLNAISLFISGHGADPGEDDDESH